MNKGRIIFLNGLTSCGKTSVAEWMKRFSDEILYVVSNDIFHGMTDRKFFSRNYWNMVAHTITAQYHAVRGMAQAGYQVVVDGMLLDLTAYREQFGRSNWELVREIFSGLDVTYVNFVCSPEELRRRNRVRGDRGEFQSDEQAELMTKDFTADLEIDCMTSLPDESARKILSFCSLPYTVTGENRTEMALERKKLFTSLFGTEVTVLPGENIRYDGYPIELTMLAEQSIGDICRQLAERGYVLLSHTKRILTFLRGHEERLRILTEADGDLTHSLSQLGKTLTVTVDRPMNSVHPNHPNLIYPVNYGYAEGISSGDGEWMDVYILGISEPLTHFTGKICGVIHRFDDRDDKLIALPDGYCPSNDEIRRLTGFCEDYFDSMIFRLSD